MSTCPKYSKCPIYQKTVSANKSILENFKYLYCLAGEEKYTKCKRYIVSEKTGKLVPDYIYPNTNLSVEEIIDIIKKNEEDK